MAKTNKTVEEKKWVKVEHDYGRDNDNAAAIGWMNYIGADGGVEAIWDPTTGPTFAAASPEVYGMVRGKLVEHFGRAFSAVQLDRTVAVARAGIRRAARAAEAERIAAEEAARAAERAAVEEERSAEGLVVLGQIHAALGEEWFYARDVEELVKAPGVRMVGRVLARVRNREGMEWLLERRLESVTRVMQYRVLRSEPAGGAAGVAPGVPAASVSDATAPQN